MGEITNVIAGQAKAMLHGTPHRFAFSTPRLLSGGDPVPGAVAGREFLVVVFASDAGDFTLQLCPTEGEGEGA
jgi:CheY-specific phosphatase CheX